MSPLAEKLLADTLKASIECAIAQRKLSTKPTTRTALKAEMTKATAQLVQHIEKLERNQRPPMSYSDVMAAHAKEFG